jgi:predicted nuclease of predicted toxin-antitoxin system
VSLRFLLDEDISYRVADGLRRRGVDAVSVYEVDRANRRIPDDEQLVYAAREGRVLVTYNRNDYQALDGQWRADGRSHAGIIWCSERTIPRRAVGDLVRALEVASSLYGSLESLCLPLGRPDPS